MRDAQVRELSSSFLLARDTPRAVHGACALQECRARRGVHIRSGVGNQKARRFKQLGHSAARGHYGGFRAQMAIIHYTKEDELAFYRCQTNTANRTHQGIIVPSHALCTPGTCFHIPALEDVRDGSASITFSHVFTTLDLSKDAGFPLGSMTTRCYCIL